MTEERLIKKYANRRLYDASQSRHITLDDIRTLIMGGEKIKVVDDKSGEDITRHILLQVIADQEQFGRPILSTQVLESLIRYYGNAMQGFLSSYLEKSIEAFMHQQDVMQSQMSKLMTAAPINTMAELTRQNLEAWNKLQGSMFSAFKPPREEQDSPSDSEERRS